MVEGLRVEGLKQLDEALRAMPKQMAMKIVKDALREESKIVRDAARKKVPIAKRSHLAKKQNQTIGQWINPGNLRKSISYWQTRSNRLASNISDEFQVGVSKKRAFYAHFVEGGTKPHQMPKKGKSKIITLRFPDGSTRTYTSENPLMHPGAKAKPFLLPALEENTQRCINKFTEILDNGIRRVCLEHGFQVQGKIFGGYMGG